MMTDAPVEDFTFLASESGELAALVLNPLFGLFEHYPQFVGARVNDRSSLLGGQTQIRTRSVITRRLTLLIVLRNSTVPHPLLRYIRQNIKYIHSGVEDSF